MAEEAVPYPPEERDAFVGRSFKATHVVFSPGLATWCLRESDAIEVAERFYNEQGIQTDLGMVVVIPPNNREIVQLWRRYP